VRRLWCIGLPNVDLERLASGQSARRQGWAYVVTQSRRDLLRRALQADCARLQTLGSLDSSAAPHALRADGRAAREGLAVALCTRTQCDGKARRLRHEDRLLYLPNVGVQAQPEAVACNDGLGGCARLLPCMPYTTPKTPHEEMLLD
jgi:hypothetical protein